MTPLLARNRLIRTAYACTIVAQLLEFIQLNPELCERFNLNTTQILICRQLSSKGVTSLDLQHARKIKSWMDDLHRMNTAMSGIQPTMHCPVHCVSESRITSELLPRLQLSQTTNQSAFTCHSAQFVAFYDDLHFEQERERRASAFAEAECRRQLAFLHSQS